MVLFCELQAAMLTMDRARELLAVQADFGGFYNRNAAKLILQEVARNHGQKAVDRLIQELGLEAIFHFKPGTEFRPYSDAGS